MDQWDFKKWRKKLGVNQVAAGEMLGLSRGAVQYWESEIRPVPRTVELACQELLRRWKQRPEFGPVSRVVRLRETMNPFMTFIVEGDGTVISGQAPNCCTNAMRKKARTATEMSLVCDQSAPAVLLGQLPMRPSRQPQGRLAPERAR
jgi:DNA-binding XRE family transcriptional regulator